MEKEVFSPNGKLLSKQEIKEYRAIKKYLIRKMKNSPRYYKQLQMGDLSQYEEVLEELKLKDQDGKLINDEEIYQLIDFENMQDKGVEK